MWTKPCLWSDMTKECYTKKQTKYKCWVRIHWYPDSAFIFCLFFRVTFFCFIAFTNRFTYFFFLANHNFEFKVCVSEMTYYHICYFLIFCQIRSSLNVCITTLSNFVLFVIVVTGDIWPNSSLLFLNPLNHF